MATRTIAPGGGNWNATTTWVEGVVPVNGDLVVGAANSGNLTINVNPSFQYVMDMTNYAATMSIATAAFNMPSNISSPLLATSTFSSAMTITSTAPTNLAIRQSGVANTWAFLGNGTLGEFPILNISQVSQALTISGTLRASTLLRTNGSTTINRDVVRGGTMSVRRYQAFNGGGNLLLGTCPIVFDRETGEWVNSNNLAGGFVNVPVVINTPGTFSITPTSGNTYGFIGIRAGGTFTYIQGKISNTNKNLWLCGNDGGSGVIANTTTNIDLGGSGTWSSIHISDTFTGTYNANTQNTYNLVSDLYFDELRLQPNNGSGQFVGNRDGYRIITRFTGSGRLKGGYLVGQAIFNSFSFQASTVPTADGISYFNPRIQLSTGLPTHDFTGIRLYGIPDPTNLDSGGSSPSYCSISTQTGIAYIKVVEPTSFGVAYTNIDASAGTQIQSYFGAVLAGSTNIVNTNALPSGGGGERATLYIN